MKNEKMSIAANEFGYSRENNGDWILMIGEGDDKRRLGTVSAIAKAKRGQGWNTPDPEGEATAKRICDLWNSQIQGESK